MLANFIRATVGAFALSFAFAASAQDVPAATPEATATPVETPAAAVTAPVAPGVGAAPVVAGTGTLVIDVLPFSSEIELKKKVKAQLESGGLEWGQKGDRLVFSLVNKRFVNFDLAYFTRYGSQQTLQLPAGEYRITGIGLIPSTGFNVDKILSKGAYFNEDLVRFRVEAGQTTKLTINPVIRKEATLFLNFFIPQLLASVTTGAGTTEPLSLNAKYPGSMPWDNYQGDLKFARTP